MYFKVKSLLLFVCVCVCVWARMREPVPFLTEIN